MRTYLLMAEAAKRPYICGHVFWWLISQEGSWFPDSTERLLMETICIHTHAVLEGIVKGF